MLITLGTSILAASALVSGWLYYSRNDNSTEVESHVYIPTKTNCEDTNLNQIVSRSTQLHFRFSRENPSIQQDIVEIIQNAKRSLDIAIFSITDPVIIQAISEAKQRGIRIRLISDANQGREYYQSPVLDKLNALGVPQKINTFGGSMHLKLVIADNSIVTTGSYNYTRKAAKYNEEMIIVTNDAVAVQKCKAHFESMWVDSIRYKELQYNNESKAS